METIEQDINICSSNIKHHRKMLVFQSTAPHIVDEVVENLLKINGEISIIVWGRDNCKYMQEKFGGRVTWIEHNKKFDDNDIDYVKKIVNEEVVDSLLFFNNYVNCVDFSNVEHIAMFVEQKATIYSYSYVQKEFNRHHNVGKHVYGEILYKDLLEWYKIMRKEERSN